MRVLIVGTTTDDISYIQTKMTIESIDTIAGDVEVYTGKYSDKDIVLVATGKTNMLSAMICGIVIEKYHPYYCISIGNIHSFSSELKQTDLFLATRIYLANIDQMPLGRLSYGQIPDMKLFYTPESTLNQKIKDLNSTMANKNLVTGILISDDLFRTDPKEIDELIKEHYVKIENIVACDSSSGGVSIACSKYKLPTVFIRVCSYEVGNSSQLINCQRKGLSVQPYVGKLISALFED